MGAWLSANLLEQTRRWSHETLALLSPRSFHAKIAAANKSTVIPVNRRDQQGLRSCVAS